MAKTHPLLEEFQKKCHEHYTCFVLSVHGIRAQAEQTQLRGVSPEGAKLLLSPSDRDPALVNRTAEILVKDLIKFSQVDGRFTDVLAKAILVSLYSEWDEYYRPKFATDIGVHKNMVRCDLMGDVRHIRHCIVHQNSRITNEHTKMKVLDWGLKPGELSISLAMMTRFIDLTNTLIVEILEDASSHGT